MVLCGNCLKITNHNNNAGLFFGFLTILNRNKTGLTW